MTQSFVAEVTVDHPDLPLTPTIRDITGTRVRLESQPLTDAESPSLFYSVTDSGFQGFESALERDHTVEDWELTMDLTDCRIYRIRPSSDARYTVPKVVDLGIRVLTIRNAGRRWWFQLQAPDRESLGAYWRYCREEGVQFTLEKLYSSSPQAAAVDADATTIEAQLTDRQREVALTVTRMGYYEQDGASAEEVAAELDISPSTLSTHLRRIMAKVFHSMFGDELREE